MSLLGSSIGLGIVKGSVTALEKEKQRRSPQAQAQRAQAAVLKEQQEQKLRELQGTRKTDDDIARMGDIQSQELVKLQQENKALQGQMAKRSTYEAFDRFAGDNDVRHLNTLLTDLSKFEGTKGLFGNIVRVDKISAEDSALMRKQGIDPNVVLNNKEALVDTVRVTKSDGSIEIVDLDNVRAMTGYSRYETNRAIEFRNNKLKGAKGGHARTSVGERAIARQLEVEGLKEGSAAYARRFVELEQASKIKAVAPKRGSVSERSVQRQLEAEGLAKGTAEYNERFVEIEKERREDSDPYDGSKIERIAASRVEASGVAKDDPEFRAKFNAEVTSLRKEDRQSAKSRNLTEAETATREIDALTDNTFFSTETDTAWKQSPKGREVAFKIAKIEQLAGAKFSEADKKALGNIGQLVNMGDPASQLSDAETGIVDSVLHFARQYVSDNVSGTDKTVAFAMYRNMTRHALFGSALTEGEIKAFNEQFGSLGQQKGPILTALKQNLLQVKARIEVTRSLNNQYVTHYRLGASRTKLTAILASLDERIALIDQSFSGLSTTNKPLSASRRAELDAVLEGGE